MIGLTDLLQSSYSVYIDWTSICRKCHDSEIFYEGFNKEVSCCKCVFYNWMNSSQCNGCCLLNYDVCHDSCKYTTDTKWPHYVKSDVCLWLLNLPRPY